MGNRPDDAVPPPPPGWAAAPRTAEIPAVPSGPRGRAASVVRSLPGKAQAAELEALVVEGRYGDAALALQALDEVLEELDGGSDGQALLLALYGRAVLLQRVGAGLDACVEACDLLEHTAGERLGAAWAAIACGERATVRLDRGDPAAALTDLVKVDLETLDGDPGTDGLLLDALAGAYARLRLGDRSEETRGRLEELVDDLPLVDVAAHWTAWSTELTVQALEPVAAGADAPDERLLDRAVAIAARLEDLPADAVPAVLLRAAAGVRALAAAHRGRPAEALRLLAADAFREPRDLPPLHRQVVTLAAVHAHALLGSIATARTLDEGAAPPTSSLPSLLLEVCRARERLWLETHAGGDLVPLLTRLSSLLVRLGWQGLGLVSETARQALEHHALRVESRTDPLTGVGNRRALDEELRHMLRFTPLPLALVLVDIDDFKAVNDTYSHAVGDEVLRRVAESLGRLLRVGDRLVRYGGDEFVVLLPRTGDQEARHVASRMGQAVTGLAWGELAEGLQVGVTTGSAALWAHTGRRPDKDAEQLFRQADEVLLEAKRLRREGPVTPPAGIGRRRRGGERLERPTRGAPPDETPAPAQERRRPHRVVPHAEAGDTVPVRLREVPPPTASPPPSTQPPPVPSTPVPPTPAPTPAPLPLPLPPWQDPSLVDPGTRWRGVAPPPALSLLPGGAGGGSDDPADAEEDRDLDDRDLDDRDLDDRDLDDRDLDDRDLLDTQAIEPPVVDPRVHEVWEGDGPNAAAPGADPLPGPARHRRRPQVVDLRPSESPDRSPFG